MEGPKDIRRDRFLVKQEHWFLVGKMSGIVNFPYFGIILQVCALKCPRFKSDKSVRLCGLYHQQAWIWRTNRLESARGAQTERPAFCLSLCLYLRVRNFQNRPLGKASNRKESGPSARLSHLGARAPWNCLFLASWWRFLSIWRFHQISDFEWQKTKRRLCKRSDRDHHPSKI